MSLLTAAQESVHCIIRQAFHFINDNQFDFLDFLGRFQAQVQPQLTSKERDLGPSAISRVPNCKKTRAPNELISKYCPLDQALI